MFTNTKRLNLLEAELNELKARVLTLEATPNVPRETTPAKAVAPKKAKKAPKKAASAPKKTRKTVYTLNARDVADKTGYSRDTVVRLARSEAIAGKQVNGSWRFPNEAVEALRARRKKAAK